MRGKSPSAMRMHKMGSAQTNHKQNVIFLGEHANLVFAVDDTIVLSGVHVQEWRQERTLETTFLTIVEINPTRLAQLDHLHCITRGSWHRHCISST